MPKLGDIIFYKDHDVETGEPAVSPAIVTRVFTDEDGEWAKGRQITEVTIFGHNGGVRSIQADRGSLDDDGQWSVGGWAETEDGSDLGGVEEDMPAASAALPEPPSETAVTGTPAVPAPAPAVGVSPMDDHPSGLEQTTGIDTSQPMTQVTDVADERASLDRQIRDLLRQRDALGD